jgi:hypothetical protein
VSVLSTDQKKQLKKVQKRVPDSKAFKKQVARHLETVKNNLPDVKQLEVLNKTLNKKLPNQKQSHKGSIFGAILLIGAIGGLVYWAVKSGKLRDEDLFVNDVAEDTKKKVKDVVSNVKDKVSDVKDKAQEATDEAKNKADKPEAKEAGNKAADKTVKATDKAADAVETSTKEATAAVHEAAQKAKRD